MAADWRARGRRLQRFVVDNFLPLAFAVAIIWALAWPVPGKAVISVTIMDGSVHVIQEVNIIIVFLISGLVLKTEDITAALKHKLGVAYGLISILFVTPCLGFAFRAIPLQPSEFAAGLTLFAAVPTTLGIGVSLVRTWRVDIPNLLAKLVVTILVPSVIGKALRELPPFNKRVKKFTADWKTALSLFSVFNLAMIVWQSLSGARDNLFEQQIVQVLYVILLAVGQHLAYLAFNFPILQYVFKMPLVERIATGVMSSQKSAPVAVTVISYLSSNISQQGLLIIPCVVGQIAQIFIGSALAKYFARQVKRQQRLAAADAAPDLGSKAPLADADPDVSVGGEGLTVKDSCKTLPSLSDGSGDASPTAAAGSDGDGHVTAGDLEAGVAAEPAAAADGEKR